MEYINTVHDITAVTVSRKRLAKAAAAVAASEAKIEEQRAQITTINAELEKAENNAETAADILSTLRTDMETKEEGTDNLEHADWLRIMEAKTKNDSETAVTVKKEINCRFKSITEEE